MTENMKNFLAAVSKDEELVKKISTMTKEELLALARELGVGLTEAWVARRSALAYWAAAARRKRWAVMSVPVWHMARAVNTWAASTGAAVLAAASAAIFPTTACLHKPAAAAKVRPGVRGIG